MRLAMVLSVLAAGTAAGTGQAGAAVVAPTVSKIILRAVETSPALPTIDRHVVRVEWNASGDDPVAFQIWWRDVTGNWKVTGQPGATLGGVIGMAATDATSTVEGQLGYHSEKPNWNSSYGDNGTIRWGLVEVPAGATLDFAVIARENWGVNCNPSTPVAGCQHSAEVADVQVIKPPMPARSYLPYSDSDSESVAPVGWTGNSTQGTYRLRRSLATANSWTLVNSQTASLSAQEWRGQTRDGVGYDYALDRTAAITVGAGSVEFVTESSIASGVEITKPFDPLWAGARAGARFPSAETRLSPNVYLHPNGNDANSGTGSSSGQAFLTINRAVAARPVNHVGNWVIQVADGTYREQSATVNRPNVVLQAAPDASPIFKGSREFVASWTKHPSFDLWKQVGAVPFGLPAACVDADNNNIWDVEPCIDIPDQVDASYPAADDVEQLFRNGDPVEQIEPTLWGVSVVPSNLGSRFYLDRGANEVWVAGASAPTGTWEWSTTQRAVHVTTAATGFTMVGIRFMHYSPFHRNVGATLQIDADGSVLKDVAVTYSAGAGIGLNTIGLGVSPTARFERVTASMNGAEGAKIGGSRSAATPSTDGLVITKSRFDRNNASNYSWADCAESCVLAGLKITGAKKTSITYSSFSSNTANGIWCDLFCDGFVLAGSIVDSNSGTGVYYEVSKNALIESNQVTRNGDPSAGISMFVAAGVRVGGSRGVSVVRNTIADNPFTGLFVYDDDRSYTPSGFFGLTTDGSPQVTAQGNLIAEGTTGNPVTARPRLVWVFDQATAGSLNEGSPWSGWMNGLDSGAVSASGSGKNGFVHQSTTNNGRYHWGSSASSGAATYSTQSASEWGYLNRTASMSGLGGAFVGASVGDFRALSALLSGWSDPVSLTAIGRAALDVSTAEQAFGAYYAQ